MPVFKINDTQKIAVVSRRVASLPNFVDSDFVLISIRDSDAPWVDVPSTHLVEALRLSFDDIDGPLPHCVCATVEDARKIVDFTLTHADVSVIMCQCEAGVSRSAAVAAAILWRLTGDDSEVFTNRFLYPNRYVYRLVVEEFVRRGSPHPPKFDHQIPFVEPGQPIL